MTSSTAPQQLAKAGADDGDALSVGTGLAGAPPPIRARGYRTIALVVACALFMQQLDATVLTIALPAMARDLGVAPAELSLALTSYLVALAMFIPASGYLADRWGPRTVFCTAIATFVLGSIACAQAWSVTSLVGARFLQGTGGAMMMPVGRLVLLLSVSRDDLVAALSWLVMPALIGPILGPPIGGLIVTYSSWQWIFYLNVPIGIAGVVLALILIPDVREGGARAAFDWCGFALAGIALAALVFGFELTTRPGAEAVTAVLLGTGTVLALLYLRHARRRPDAILDLRLLAVPSFRISVVAGSLTRITQGAQPFLLPLMFQLGFGMSAAKTGTITLASALGALLVKPIAPGLIRRFGYRDPMLVAVAIASLGYASCAAFRPDWTVPTMFAILMVSGLFMSLLFTGYNALAFIDIKRSRMNAATSFYATFQQLSLSVGICLAAVLLRVAGPVVGTAASPLAPYSLAFLGVAGLSFTAILSIIFLSREVGRKAAPSDLSA
ncbi:MFS transporter [Sphingomonas sp. Leaf339]|uniref:MFS transporter n=1 Tax=Sphingomonas sp. Leaf339 TaxID=1736343 RepID=UPI0009E9F0B6|nr:MFS transporter [Sphingomonas sp. Leaf339]